MRSTQMLRVLLLCTIFSGSNPYLIPGASSSTEASSIETYFIVASSTETYSTVTSSSPVAFSSVATSTDTASSVASSSPAVSSTNTFSTAVSSTETSPVASFAVASSQVASLAMPPCYIYKSRRNANCMGRHLASVPQNLPPTLELIDLSYNSLSSLHSKDFSRFPKLRDLLLSFNNISFIGENAFQHNSLLETLDISDNSLRQIPDKALRHLSNLQSLVMNNNLFEQATLPESYANFPKLQVLAIGGLLVNGLKKGDFKPVRKLRLKVFTIQCSSKLQYYERGSLKVVQTQNMHIAMPLDTLPNSLLDILSDLANRTFTELQFYKLFDQTYYTGTMDIFRGLENISAYRLNLFRGIYNQNLLTMLLQNLQKTQNIKGLRLRYIDYAQSHSVVTRAAVSSITNLKLDHLDIWYISNPEIIRFDSHFTWLSKIKELSIQFTYPKAMPCEGLLAMREMELLDFSNNRLTNQYMYNPRCVYNGTMPNLQTLYYTNNELTSLKVISSSVRYFVRLKVLDVSFNHLGSAPLSTGCIWNHNITRFIAHHNEFASESLLCLPATVEYLDLSYCSLDKVDTAFFDKAVNLKEVLLSGNKIKYIPPNWKSPTLRSLELDGNSFGVITVNSFQDMPLMKSLKAGNNPYQCTCELHAFFEDTLSKAMVNLTDWPWNYHCYHPQALLNTYISKFVPGRLACDVRMVVLIAVATTAAFLMALMVVCYVFELPWYTKATYQILRAKYRAYQNPPGEEAMLRYHAFISYSHWDADWVRDQLLPALEDRGNPYRLCIHERDFTPGKWIIDNIIKNIENSHKMIFVLSRHFVNSEWCNYELYFAQQRAMGKTFHDVILVLKEPIDPGSLPNKYCKLKKMLSTRTYLEWPQQQNQRAFFWAQLRSVLGRPAVVRSRSGSQRSRGGSEEREPLVDRPGLSVEVIEERE